MDDEQLNDQDLPGAASPHAASGRRVSPAARRALAEAEARRQAAPPAGDLPPEVGGADGAEPTRFGDWERGGIASDF
jgi:hypothetical protein